MFTRCLKRGTTYRLLLLLLLLLLLIGDVSCRPVRRPPVYRPPRQNAAATTAANQTTALQPNSTKNPCQYIENGVPMYNYDAPGCN
jgi:hypothetical protein